jgi:hypothetical protein
MGCHSERDEVPTDIEIGEKFAQWKNIDAQTRAGAPLANPLRWRLPINRTG